MSDQDRADSGSDESAAKSIERLLEQRYPTLLSIVADLRAGGRDPKLRRFVDDVRREVAAVLETETSARRREEAQRVLRAMELAASVAVRIALPGSST